MRYAVPLVPCQRLVLLRIGGTLWIPRKKVEATEFDDPPAFETLRPPTLGVKSLRGQMRNGAILRGEGLKLARIEGGVAVNVKG